jgi:hypothetical protein
LIPAGTAIATFFKKLIPVLYWYWLLFIFLIQSLVLVLGSILILGWYMASMCHKIRAEMATILFLFSSVNRHNHNCQRILSTFVFHRSTPNVGWLCLPIFSYGCQNYGISLGSYLFYC